MSSMSEDAMFKALLKNKPQEKTQTAQQVEVPVRNEIKKTVPRSGSEDMMFQVLLKNKPQKQSIDSAQKAQTAQIKEKAPETQAVVNGNSINNGLSSPQQQIAQSAQNTQVKDSVQEAQIAAEQAQDRIENEKQADEIVSRSINPVQAEAVVESLKDLTARVNMVHGLLKSIIAPVLVIILIVGIAILLKI